MVYEDFTTYTEVDPGGFLTVIANKVTATNMPYSTACWVKKDYGAGHFGDFEHLLKITVTDFEAWAYVEYWRLTADDAIRTGSEAFAANKSISVHTDSTTGNFKIGLVNWVTPAADHYQHGSGTGTFYLTIKRVGTTGTCKIYSDAARTVLVDTLSLTLPNTTYRYLLVSTSREDPGTEDLSCTTENLDLQEIGNGEVGSAIYYNNGISNIELQRDDSSPVQSFNGTTIVGLKLGATNHANASPIHVWDGLTIKAILKMP